MPTVNHQSTVGLCTHRWKVYLFAADELIFHCTVIGINHRKQI